MRHTVHRVLLLAALCGAAVVVAPEAQAGQPRTLDCGTSVHDGAGTGWCRGTGTFLVKVTCADGHTQTSPTATMRNGYTQMSVACPNSEVTAAQIVVLDNPPNQPDGGSSTIINEW